MRTGTNNIHFIVIKDVPVHRTITYGRIVATVRRTKSETQRDRINYCDDKRTPTADLQTINTLLKKTISTSNATFFYN